MLKTDGVKIANILNEINIGMVTDINLKIQEMKNNIHETYR